MTNRKIYSIVAPLPGKIVNIKVQVESKVKINEPVLILEAMKMENEIVTDSDGVVKEIKVKIGDFVNTGEELVVIENAIE